MLPDGPDGAERLQTNFYIEPAELELARQVEQGKSAGAGGGGEEDGLTPGVSFTFVSANFSVVIYGLTYLFPWWSSCYRELASQTGRTGQKG